MQSSVVLYCVEMSCVTFLRTLSLVRMVPAGELELHTGAETRDGGNLGTRAGAVISHFQDTYLGGAEIIMTTPPWLEEAMGTRLAC